ncbi:MAG: histidine--tRNA ligase [Defluviitaleaceae bacterium]|nr:histidine--tRNA ligase [Defluviitaleaceae bacterium]
MAITKPKGTKDVYGDQAALWQYIEKTAREVAVVFGAQEIRTPTFERIELFRQSVGEATDIVQKEMYSFTDQGGREYVLRPEGTAGTVRAYLENSLYDLPMPAKLYYICPNFRAERPQEGRYREFYQFGAEYFGSYEASADAELISLAHLYLTRLGVENLTLHLNSIGDGECRKRYNDALLAFLRAKEENLCDLCRDRMGKNPMRVLDCKNPDCQEHLTDAPVPLDYISDEAREHFEQLQENLKILDISFVINKSIVRGLDYYTRTVFEFTSDDLGSQSTVCGGGRYDKLVEKNGGQPTGAVGFGMGMERLLIILRNQGKLPAIDKGIELFIGHMGDAGALKALEMANCLRKKGISVITDLGARGVKAQMKYANKAEAKFAAIIGDSELEKGRVTVKSMASGKETEIELDGLVSYFGNSQKAKGFT